jgi:hypothetical protein
VLFVPINEHQHRFREDVIVRRRDLVPDQGDTTQWPVDPTVITAVRVLQQPSWYTQTSLFGPLKEHLSRQLCVNGDDETS